MHNRFCLNKINRHITLLILSWIAINTIAQEPWYISGRVLDTQGNPIPSAHITTADLQKGTVSDSDGFFKLSGLQNNPVQIIIGHTAFNRHIAEVHQSASTNLSFYLELKIFSTKEIQITAENNSIVNNYIPGKLTLTKKDILSIPAFMGSPDVLRSLQLLPGIQSVSEGNSGIYVRGGSPGQNLVLLDDIELMNPTHLMGVYSVFNPFLIQKVDLFKGNAPIHQSSRLASSIIVNTLNNKENNSNWTGNIGNILSNLTYRGQSTDGKWYIGTGIRRSYLDMLGYLAEPFLKDEDNYFKQNNYTFYDWNGKLRYRNNKNTIVLSWYLGQDNFKLFNAKNNIHSHSDWGNKGTAIVWKRLLTSRISMSNHLSYSGYYSEFGADIPDGSMLFKTDYHQFKFKNEYIVQLDKNLWRFGLDLTNYDITPQDIYISYIENNDYQQNKYKSLAIKGYLSDQFSFSQKWSLYGALAVNYYRLQSIQPNISDVNHKEKAQLLPNIVVTLSYNPQKDKSWKASYAYNSQNIHLASIASIPLPSDIWMPATEKLPLENGHQFTLGYFKSNTQHRLQWGSEAYVKYMNHLSLLKINVNNEQTEQFDENFYIGKAIAWGNECYLKKQTDHFNLTASYTLGWISQKFQGINNNQWHDAKYDRRHDLNIQSTYKLNERIDFGAVFIFASGNKATLPTGRYWMMGNIANDYAGVNNFRMPPYHRLDISMNLHLTSNTFKESIINFSIINLYNRSNPYYIYFDIDKGAQDYELSIKAKQVSLFPVMPSVSWKFKF